MDKKKLVFVIVSIFFILFMIIKATEDSLKLNKLNNIYKDIEILEDKVAIYYLDYGTIPVKNEIIEDFKEKSINPNDNNIYYEIDLDKIENLNIYYGKKAESEKDIYIINEQSHTIYYYLGIEYNGKMYYAKDLGYKKVELEEYQ